MSEELRAATGSGSQAIKLKFFERCFSKYVEGAKTGEELVEPGGAQSGDVI